MSNNLTKKEIVESVYKNTQMSRADISSVLDIVLDVMAKAIIDGRNIELRNFGVFEQQVRKSRVGRNPNRPSDTVVIPERRGVKFRVGKNLFQALQTSDKN
ncbi:MAG: HU family DNA-binding protein [Puniceicoccales bacterium]|jgi:nucleoid DNA-binding protein|nr:HU family DNA-binding protein [Puniceicoccales bacterium]